MKKVGLLGIATLLSVSLLVVFFWEANSGKANNDQLSPSVIRSVYARLDPNHPGRGLPDYESDQPEDIPKSYAMVLIAELLRQEKGISPELPSLHVKAGNWLLEHSRKSPDGRVGWGVPVAWDAYGDGSINPEHTIYTISNAIVMQALLDWLDKSPSDAPRERIYQVLDAMIKPYLDESVRTPEGLLPYSLMDSDRRYDTFNPAIYFAGQLQRYSWLVDESYGKKLREIADQTMRALISHRQQDQRGHWYWHYSVQEKTPNDLPHASYIVLGIRDYLQHGGGLAKYFDWPAVRDHLFSFKRKDATLFAWPDFSKDIVLPARLYDIGIAMYVSCHEKTLKPLSHSLLESVQYYRNSSGGYQKYPVGSGQDEKKGNRVVNEYEAYLLLGLVSCERAISESNKITTRSIESWFQSRPLRSLKDIAEVPFAIEISGSGQPQRAHFDYKSLPARDIYTAGKNISIQVGRFIASDGSVFKIDRTLFNDELLLSKVDSKEKLQWSTKITHSPGSNPIFRAGAIVAEDLHIAYYDNVTQANYVVSLSVNTPKKPTLNPPYRLPSLRDPAGGTYEMIPAIFLLGQEGVLHVIGGAMRASRQKNGEWVTAYYENCESVQEAVITPLGPASLCLALKGGSHQYRVETPAGIVPPQIEPLPAIPWKLHFGEKRGLSIEHASTPADYRRMLTFDLNRMPSQGWMELGIGNTESRIPWSQIYTLNGYLDLIFLAQQSDLARDLFGWLIPESKRRLDLELALLDRVWAGGHYRTRAFTVDRSNALFAVQTSRLLLLFDRYLNEVPNSAELRSFANLQQSVAGLRNHIEVLTNKGVANKWNTNGRYFLSWPKGSAFYFDGLNVPFNHQNEWSYAVLRAAKKSVEQERTAKNILAYFRERTLVQGAFPPDGVWDYWWGTAFDGWDKMQSVSVNKPNYSGDHIKAWISFRSIDAMSTLADIDAIPASERSILLESTKKLTEQGLLYPFVSYELLRNGVKPKINIDVAARYARLSSPWGLQNAVWALARLAEEAH